MDGHAFGQWGGFYNGGPGNDSVVKRTNGPGGTTKKVENKWFETCVAIED